jgi:hypothetical protein
MATNEKYRVIHKYPRKPDKNLESLSKSNARYSGSKLLSGFPEERVNYPVDVNLIFGRMKQNILDVFYCTVREYF